MHGGNVGNTGRAISSRRMLAQTLWDDVRDEWDLTRCHPSLLTLGSHNLKLAKGLRKVSGLTLQHHVQRISKRLVVNACPNAGDCTAVCVLDNGNGGFHKVQIARRCKTAFLVEQPMAFAYLYGWDLARDSLGVDDYLHRPNVNSDVAWERLLPSLVNGTALPNVTCYGYTKRPEVLDTDGWLGTKYRVAYSWNEKSRNPAVAEFIRRGGSVAVVTSRKKDTPVDPDGVLDVMFTVWSRETTILDADKTDEWIFENGVIGDLSAKGRARRLIGKSGFVVSTGGAA
jgi:hypothetical protein